MVHRVAIALVVILTVVCVLAFPQSIALAADGSASPSESTTPAAAEVVSPPTEAYVPASPTNVPASVDYRIQEDDILRIDVWGETQLQNLQAQVTSDGKINIPYIGEIKAAGMTQAELTKEIAKRLSDSQILLDARVSVTLVKLHEPTVSVLGQVTRPGSVVFKDGATILDAIAMAGSYTDNAWLENVSYTRKGAEKPTIINVRKMLEGDLTNNFKLQQSDIIYIPPEDYQNKVYVMGHVNRPGIYSIKGATTVLAAINLAGGPDPRGSIIHTVLLRGSGAKPERIPLNLDKLFSKGGDKTQDVQLQSGDVLMVPETNAPDWTKISQIFNTLFSIRALTSLGLF